MDGNQAAKKNKYINVRYFYITDRLKAKDVSKVIYKPTEPPMGSLASDSSISTDQ